MKKFLVFSICAALFSLVSCVKDNGDNGGVVVVTPETISAKWLVEGESNYESFEFTQSGNYIVIEQGFRFTSGGVHFGTYDIDGNVLKMHGFGELTADDLKSGSFNFTLKLDSDTKTVLLMAIKQPEMANTTKTDLLCRTWVTVNETIPELDEGYDYIEKDIVVLFSKSGCIMRRILKKREALDCLNGSGATVVKQDFFIHGTGIIGIRNMAVTLKYTSSREKNWLLSKGCRMNPRTKSVYSKR